jgi:hypothetical protein
MGRRAKLLGGLLKARNAAIAALLLAPILLNAPAVLDVANDDGEAVGEPRAAEDVALEAVLSHPRSFRVRHTDYWMLPRYNQHGKQLSVMLDYWPDIAFQKVFRMGKESCLHLAWGALSCRRPSFASLSVWKPR